MRSPFNGIRLIPAMIKTINLGGITETYVLEALSVVASGDDGASEMRATSLGWHWRPAAQQLHRTGSCPACLDPAGLYETLLV